MGFPHDYQLGPHGVEVRVGPWCVRCIDYSDIESVERGYAWLNEHWTNLLPFPWRFVTIRRRSGMLKNFVISPDDADLFVAKLKKVLRK